MVNFEKDTFGSYSNGARRGTVLLTVAILNSKFRILNGSIIFMIQFRIGLNGLHRGIDIPSCRKRNSVVPASNHLASKPIPQLNHFISP